MSNPQSVHSTFVSAQGTMFTVSSIGLVMTTLATSNRDKSPLLWLVVGLSGLFVFAMSILIGLQMRSEFSAYMSSVDPEEIPPHLSNWPRWIYLSWAYNILIFSVMVAIVVARSWPRS